MIKKIKQLKTNIYSGMELLSIASVAFLVGMIVGMLTSPKGNRMYGCNNGNYSGNTGVDGMDADVAIETSSADMEDVCCEEDCEHTEA